MKQLLKMKKLSSLIILLFFLSSCVYTNIVSLSKADLKNMNGKKIAVINREKNNMILLTPYHAVLLGGLLVYFHEIYAGNKIIKENEIEDTSALLANRLRDNLIKKHNLKIADIVTTKKVNTYDVNEISALYRGAADYVIDVRTLSWGLRYVSMMDASNYVIDYSSYLRIIDINNSKVVVEGSCKVFPYKKYSKNTMLENRAEILKQEFSEAADVCLSFLKNSLINTALD